MKRILLLTLMAFVAQGCTISMSMANTEGQASDVIDSKPTTDVKTDAEVTLPVSPLP